VDNLFIFSWLRRSSPTRRISLMKNLDQEKKMARNSSRTARCAGARAKRPVAARCRCAAQVLSFGVPRRTALDLTSSRSRRVCAGTTIRCMRGEATRRAILTTWDGPFRSMTRGGDLTRTGQARATRRKTLASDRSARATVSMASPRMGPRRDRETDNKTQQDLYHYHRTDGKRRAHAARQTSLKTPNARARIDRAL
jgi:hypothetical protein